MQKIFTLLIILNMSWAAIISGYVKDSETKKSIPNANIFIRSTGQGTATNPYGYFELNISNGTFILETAVIGFETDKREIIIENENIELGIYLQTAILEFSEIKVKGLFSTRLGYESIDIIEAKEIQSMEKESISDVLRIVPGVDVQFAHPNGRNVNLSIRGSSDYKPGGYNNRVLMLLDGFPILIPNSGTPDWSSLPLESIQRIEVDNSPASAQYGHNSMGGVINLITNNPETDNSTTIKLSGGSYTTGQTSLTHRHTKGNRSYGVNAMARSSKGHRFNAEDKITRLRTYLRHGDQKGRIHSLSHIISYSDVGHPGFDVDTLISFRKSERLSQYIQGYGFYPINKGMSISHAVFLNKFDTRYYDRDDTPEDEKEGSRYYDDLGFGLRSNMLITKWARWIFMVGTDLDWSRSNVDVFNSEYKSPSQLSIGGFIQSKYSIGSGWNFGTGLRYDYRRTDPGNNHKIPIYTNFSPKVNLMYTIANERSFTLSYSEGFRAPSLSELYLLHESYLIFIGNPNLHPEKIQSIEMKYEHPHSVALYWDFSIFYNHYKNMIDFIYTNPVRAKNRQGVIAAGGEYQFKWKPIEKLSINGSYAYLDMFDRDGGPVLYRSKHRGQLHFIYQAKRINIRVGVQAWSQQIYEDFLDNYEEINGIFIFPTRELPGNIIPELILSRKLGNYTGSLRMSNLSDKRYELIQNYTMPGRNWKFTLTKTITKEKK